MTEIPPCKECGACCTPPFDYDVYVDVSARDLQRLPKNYRLKVVAGVGLSLRTRYTDSGCRCVALKGTLMQNVRCDIYTARPEVCRSFLRGGPGCLEAIREMRG